MFDYSPREDVPWFDGSLAKLYEYFEHTPELWTDAAEFMKVRCTSNITGLSCEYYLMF
jgi:hypothetical protein